VRKKGAYDSQGDLGINHCSLHTIPGVFVLHDLLDNILSEIKEGGIAMNLLKKEKAAVPGD
jgi:hypothetical protein